MKNDYKKPFYLTAIEIRGIQSLILCCFIYILTPLMVSTIIKNETLQIEYPPSICDEEKHHIATDNHHKTSLNSDLSKVTYDLMPFNPNTLSKTEARKYGIPDKVYLNLQKYLSKGGKIRNKMQMRSLYGMDSLTFTRLEPFIELPQDLPKIKTTRFQDKPPRIFDLNTIEPKDLIYTLGLDYKLAYRIINYRNALGGFCDLQQLSEVFGMQDSIASRLQAQLILRQKHLRRAIQFTSLDSLAKHPYVKFKLAKRIAQYKKEHGALKHISELKYMISDTLLLQKIENYFY